MNTPHTTLTILMVALVGLPCKSEEFRAGIATVDITPPIPYRMSGYFSERLSTGVKDPLQAKAVVFSQGDMQAALVFCDLIGISSDVARRTRRAASQATRIPTDNIAICATHSHTGPLYWGALRKFLHERAVERHGSDIHETVDYPAQLVDRLVAVIKRAESQAAPVTLRGGNASERRLSFNRRFHMKNGTVRFNPGQQNPDIVRTAGPIDPQVGIIWISPASEGRKSVPSGAIVSFALHLDTVGGTEYSADYPKHLEDELRGVYGPEFVAMFGAGTCGDINHIDVSIKTRRSANEIGTMLGKTVAAADGFAIVSQPSLAVSSRTVSVPMQTFSDDRVAQAVREMQFVDQPRKMSFIDRVETYKINAVQIRDGATLDLEVQAFRLSNDLAIVTLPGEVFVELGLAIKAGSPFATTLVIELTNDAPGYIPTKKAFAEGSYETVNSRIAPGGGEIMLRAAVELLTQLKRS